MGKCCTVVKTCGHKLWINLCMRVTVNLSYLLNIKMYARVALSLDPFQQMNGGLHNNPEVNVRSIISVTQVVFNLNMFRLVTHEKSRTGDCKQVQVEGTRVKEVAYQKS